MRNERMIEQREYEEGRKIPKFIKRQRRKMKTLGEVLFAPLNDDVDEGVARRLQRRWWLNLRGGEAGIPGTDISQTRRVVVAFEI